jgi:hypothetical protein
MDNAIKIITNNDNTKSIYVLSNGAYMHFYYYDITSNDLYIRNFEDVLERIIIYLYNIHYVFNIEKITDTKYKCYICEYKNSSLTDVVDIYSEVSQVLDELFTMLDFNIEYQSANTFLFTIKYDKIRNLLNN